MTPELTALTLAALLQMVQLILYAVPANLELGAQTTMGPRDPEKQPRPIAEQLTTRTGRLLRAFNNHNEALLLFAVATGIITVTGQSTAITAACAWIYLAARIAYIPAYAFGWVPARSLIFMAGWGATLVLLIAALL
ncbi:MAPEG family protein [Palleronia caenipelagi]|uniref:MAPEG family protein n=1 Tax=Palleronia caenipelagi TaxID=2489174 RepID=A0A547QB50_9RHOB|nr:MAPEG family protein [Palleronia caenipelagi]TRD23556.1 MAPEG family protein [Palleronia caenipelagi]